MTVYSRCFGVYTLSVVALVGLVKRYDSITGKPLPSMTLTCDFGCLLYLQVSPFRSHCHYPLPHLILPHCHRNADLSLWTLMDLSNDSEPQAIKHSTSYTLNYPYQTQGDAPQCCTLVKNNHHRICTHTIYKTNVIVPGMKPLIKHYCFHIRFPKMFTRKTLFSRKFFYVFFVPNIKNYP